MASDSKYNFGRHTSRICIKIPKAKLFLPGLKDITSLRDNRVQKKPTYSLITTKLNPVNKLIISMLACSILTVYFPIQNLEKILSNKSSVETLPVISPR
jgi:hypothetical protein